MYALKFLGEFANHTVKTLLSHDDRFIHDFRRKILNQPGKKGNYGIAEKYRQELYQDHQVIKTASPGAGSRSDHKKFTVSEYARLTSASPGLGRLLYGLVTAYKPMRIIELGTSFGMGSLYLALANPDATIITVEGNPEVAEGAEKYLKKYMIRNVTIVNRLFDPAVDEISKDINSGTLVCIDGNHTYEATLRYRQKLSASGIMVFDDIRWSVEMMKAWRDIGRLEGAGTIIDLFRAGVIFPEGINKEYALWL